MENKKMFIYEYAGPVYIFESMVLPFVIYRTKAVSLPKAKNNIMFNIKKQLGRTANSRINLPGTFKLIMEDPVINKEKYIQMRMDI